MNSIEKLTQIFSEFPGIGPRQAKRFVYFLLTRNDGTLADLQNNLSDLKNDVVLCAECQRFYERKSRESNLCSICSNNSRDRSTLMIVQRDVDLEAVERKGDFKGIYFVLGGSLPILEKEPEKSIRITELKSFLLQKSSQLREIILAVNWNPEGENTASFVEKNILSILPSVKISHLGKGLSMGTELEYADTDTLKNALKNRG